ncbi:ribosome biogenesis GTP-binding protein YihA/YsxC [Catenisphaera adipataccumulans]|jgi:GTP-binding protein|uniref:Probable GTP-binding protein EngB n=1 Tax=Catenisphaera adipataccumulans TaxID=700500 RepID=A0A7W8CXV2_9FIRM|nr:ribosome biogenesis GTP-binding protein YihA/YsxC [Catenisphaera adipataccumulans]MBB5183615.1 GTP-binding protein [Catenisphaera adipataccumulans]
MKAEFVISAVKPEQWPQEGLPETVVVGRSNVGKSSFINALTERKKLAYVGNTPGKTRLINFFRIDERWMLVDVPGYGYAKMSKKMLMEMGRMMDTYFQQRQEIACVVQLVDARHDPTQDDIDMMEYLQALHLPILVAATKVDKVPKTKRVRAIKNISQILHIPVKSVYPVSSTEKTGFEEVRNRIDTFIQRKK